MRKRFFCLICAAVLLMCCALGTRVTAAAWHLSRPNIEKHMTVTRIKPVRRPSPLVSAMFLILAGMGISLLFDKKGDS